MSASLSSQPLYGIVALAAATRTVYYTSAYSAYNQRTSLVDENNAGGNSLFLSSQSTGEETPQLKTRRVGPSHSEQPRVQPGAAPLQGSGEETASEKGATEGPAKESGAEGGAEGGAGKETVGGVVNFYGSSSEATLPPAEASCDPPGVVQHAEETVLTSAIAPHVLQTPSTRQRSVWPGRVPTAGS